MSSGLRSCELWREAISAAADGEPVSIERRLLDAHVASCGACRAYAENVHLLRRAAGVEVASAMPDLAGTVVKAARAFDRKSVWWILRVALGVVGMQVIVLSAPALFLGHSSGSDEHAARHIGSFAIAYAIGLLVVAFRPAKARGLLPVAAALAGCLAITAVIDVAAGRVPAVTEVDHIPEVIGLVLVWLMAMPKRLPNTPSMARQPMLRVVRPDAVSPADVDERRANH